MADITVPGPLSGRNYNFRIAGESPSVDERMRMDAHISQAEQGFMQEYEQVMGRPLETGEGSGVLNWLGEFPKGVISGAVGLGETAGLGIAAMLPEGPERAAREAIRAGAYALKPQADIGMEDTVSGKFGQAVGSFLPFLAAAPISTPLAIAAGAGEASERARRAGATPVERNLALLPGAAIGFSEKFTPNFIKALGKKDALSTVQRLKRAAASAGVEGAQEAAAEIAQNLVSKGIYDPDQGVFTGSGESAGYGAGVGALVQGLMDLAVPGRSRGAAPLALPAPDAVSPTPEGEGGFDDGTGGPPATVVEEQPTEAERAAAQAVQGLPDPTAPVTTRTLDELGIPKKSPIYRRFQDTIFSGPEAADQLQQLLDSVDATPRTEYVEFKQKVAPRVRDFIDELRVVQNNPPVPRGPAIDEADAFEAAAAESKVAREAAAAAKPKPEVPPAAKADMAKTPKQMEMDLGPVEDSDAVLEEEVAVEPEPEPITVYHGGVGDVRAAADEKGAWFSETTDLAQEYAFGDGSMSRFTITPKRPIEFVHAEQRRPIGDVISTAVENAYDLSDEAIAASRGKIEVLRERYGDAARPLFEYWNNDPDVADLFRTLGYDSIAVAEKSGGPKTWAALTPAIITPAVAPAPNLEPDATPNLEPDATPAPREPMTGAIPGAELGTAGQNIPAPVAPAARPAPSAPVQEAMQSPAWIPDDPATNVALGNRIAEKFVATAPRALELQTRSLVSTAETMPTTTKDKTVVLELLDNPPAKPKGRKTTQQYSAYAYFKNYPDVGTALLAIVSDVAAAGSGLVPKFRSTESIMAGEGKTTPQLEADLAMYEDTGTEPAKRALEWVRRKMSSKTVAALEELESRYLPLDYEKQSDEQDAVAEVQAERRELEKDYYQSIMDPGQVAYDEDAASDLGLSQEDMSDIDRWTADWRPAGAGGAPLHPRVTQYLRNGDLLGALRNLRLTATDKYAARLAAKLAGMLPNVRVGVVTEATMARIEAVMRPGQTPDPQGAPRGVYIPTPTPEALADLRRQGRDEAADLATQYGGSILLNETSGLDVTTLLHEVSHAALDHVTRNPSHPLTRKLTTLMSKITPQVPPGFNGAENLQEFVAEGLTNPEFRREMSLLNPDGAKFSAWETFVNDVKNFFRRLLGAEPRSLESATDVIDRVLDAVIAARPEDRAAGDIMGSSFRPRGAREVLDKFKDRVKVATPADMEAVRGHLRNQRIPTRYKEGMVWLTMNLDYVADAATRYFPETARTIHDLVNQHRTKKQDIMDEVTESLVPTTKWVETNSDKIDTFNDVRFTATRFGADPRNKRSEYEGFSFKYDRIDPVSGDVVSETSSRFKTRDDLNAAMAQHNRAGLPGHSEASVDFAEDSDQLDAYDEVMRGYQSLGPDGRKAMDTLFSIPETLTENLAEALKTRLEALLPGQRDLQERIYGKIYDKVFNGTGVTPYQALSRTGDFALSYYGADPKKVQLDADGNYVGAEPDVEYMTHSFQTGRERDIAIRLLKDQPAGFMIDENSITPYQQDDRRKRDKMPDAVAGKLLATIDAAGLESSVRDSVLEMILDTAPESSFMQMFRTRKGTRGFVGDITPLQQGLTAGDTIANIRDNSLRLAGNIVDIEFGAKFSKARSELTKEYKETGPTKNAKDVEEAKLYYDALMSYTESVFRRQGETAQLMNTTAYGLTLGANVSSALITFSSLPVYVYPYLAGKHGSKSALQALGHATRLIAGSGVTRTVSRITSTGARETFRKKGKFFEISIDNLDLSDPSNPQAYMSALQATARLNGLVGRSLTQDLTAGEHMTGRMALLKKAVAVSGVMQSTAERLTREATAVAKYHLALRDIAKAQRMGDFSIKQMTKKLEDGSLRFTDAQYQAAAADAMNVAEKTNGPMFSAAASQAAQSDLGSVLFLYKKHSLAMYNLLYQTLMRSVPTKAEIEALPLAERADALEDRRVARWQLGGMGGMLAMTSGALGLPLAQQIGWIYDAFAGDDEEDFKTVLRTSIGEAGAYGLLDYLTGLRVSERIGLGAPFYRAGLNSADTPLGWQIIEGFGGPVVGLATKYVDRAIPLLMEGDIQRGTEAMLPSAIANMFRAARYAQEGVLTRRGDPIIDDISPASILAQAIGFMPAAYSRQLDQNAALSRVDNSIRTKRAKLLSDRYQAFRNGDRETFREVEAKIAEFNRENPGKPRITEKTKKASLAANMKTTARMHHGVNLSDQNILRLMDLANQYGPATIWE